MDLVKTSSIVLEKDILIEKNINNLGNLLINSKTNFTPRAATAHKHRLWDFGVIPYVIDGRVGFDSDQKVRFREAMNEWENVTCLKFVEWNPYEHTSFIHFTTSTICDCCTFIGKQGFLVQDVYINQGCHTKGIILHELGHVIGFDHEQNRPDRDSYITIQKQYITPGAESQFNKATATDVDSLGEPYDFGSIMHYGPYDYSNGGPIIQVHPRWHGLNISTFGHRDRLSPTDIRQTNKLYNCPICGRTFHDVAGLFRAPNYKKIRGKILRCEWLISVPQGRRIQFFISTGIFVSKKCKKSYVEIRDGYWHKSPLFQRICGTKHDLSFQSTGNRMLINFVTDTGVHSDFAAGYLSI